MEPQYIETATGFLVTVDGISYLMEWINDMLKVSGGDVCYYILETVRGVEQATCDFSTYTLLIPNF